MDSGIYRSNLLNSVKEKSVFIVLSIIKLKWFLKMLIG